MSRDLSPQCIDRYEVLRGRALNHLAQETGWGLTLFLQRGMLLWLETGPLETPPVVTCYHRLGMSPQATI